MTDKTVTNPYTELSNCFTRFTAVLMNHGILGAAISEIYPTLELQIILSMT